MLKCDAVFQGGGVKGIGFIGAVVAIEKAGYVFENLAGTSAGAIVASLLAVGYTGREIEAELMNVDYNLFREDTWIGGLGPLGKLISSFLLFGIYKADYFENWLNELLSRKHKTVFGDIRTDSTDPRYSYKFQAIASDVSEKRMLVLPGDLAMFGIDPDSFSIARAVRMSMSIPFYYIPYKLKGRMRKSLIVDGGLLSNYPVWLLDDGTSEPPWPTFGFKFSESEYDSYSHEYIDNFFNYIRAIIETLLDAHDNREIDTSKGDHKRSIVISTKVCLSNGDCKKIKSTDFDITKKESRMLFENGIHAANKFLEKWDFENWKAEHRQKD